MLRSRSLIIPGRGRKEPGWRLKKITTKKLSSLKVQLALVVLLAHRSVPLPLQRSACSRPPLPRVPTSQRIPGTSVDLPPSRSSFQLCFFFLVNFHLSAKLNLLSLSRRSSRALRFPPALFCLVNASSATRYFLALRSRRLSLLFNHFRLP